MLRATQLDVDRAMVLVVDMQEKLLPLIPGRERIILASEMLLCGSDLFGLPVIATEQYPKGIGRTVETIRKRLDANHARMLEKRSFSAWAEPIVREAILEVDRPQVVIAGIEAHICVQQTALDLRSRDYDVFICADAVGSRHPIDYEQSLGRMRQGGAFVTTVESVLFELCNRCDTPSFKTMVEWIKKGNAR